MLTVQTPQLNFNSDGVPCSTEFNDPYFSLENGIKESRYVFIQGNNLTKRWSKLSPNSQHFTVAEIGFGFGLNFITSCEEWLQHENSSNLHYISLEKYPVKKNDIIKLYSALNISSKLTQELIKHYPVAVAGSHRIHLDQLNITLTLIFDDALNYLKKTNLLVHAWYLDGFSPNKNPRLWSKEIAHEIFRQTYVNGTFSTYSAASIVKKNFSSAGFEISKCEGFGKKREMLTGIKTKSTNNEILPYKYKNWLNTKPKSYKSKTAIVVGAGMAGCLISAALAKRNWHITLLDKHSSIANEGSGNPNAILMPRLSIDHDAQSQLTLQGFLYSVRYFNQLANYTSFSWHQSGAIQLPRDEAQWLKMQTLTQKHSIPHELLHTVNQFQASELSNCKISKDGWHIPYAGSLNPKLLCNTLLKLYERNISFISNTQANIIKQTDEIWTVNDACGNTFTADILILANAIAINQFQQSQWCTLNPKRGQITYIPQSACNINPEKIICADAYITPEVNSQLITGATFITNDDKTDVRENEHNENLIKLSRLIPSFKAKTTENFTGRAAIRAVSDDRMPVIGPVSNADDFFIDYKNAALGSTHHEYPTSKTYTGLYMLSGFGSRGLSWIPLCAESLACIICNEPSPIDNHLLQSVHPNRILMKHLLKQTK